METVPFNVKRFKGGELAYCGVVKVKYVAETLQGFEVEFERGTRAVYTEKELTEDGWTMLPPAKEPTEAKIHAAIADALVYGFSMTRVDPRDVFMQEPTEADLISQGLLDPWHEHDDGECPIPWAKKGEWECELANTEKRGNGCGLGRDGDSVHFSWPTGSLPEYRITKFRLTNGWLLVKGDGSIPDGIEGAKAGEWEVMIRMKEVLVKNFDVHGGNYFKHVGKEYDAVAVRRIVPAIPVEVNTKIDAAVHKTPGKCINPPGIKSDPKLLEDLKKSVETEKQRLTREAYERYKAKQPVAIPYRSINFEAERDSAISAAEARGVRLLGDES